VTRRRGCGLDAGDVVVVAAEVLAIPPEGILALLGERELTALTTAVAAADEAFAGDAPPGDSFERPCRAAAVLLAALVEGRPFPRDNRAVAVAAMLQLLGLHRLEPDPAVLESLPGFLARPEGADPSELLALLHERVHVQPPTTGGGFVVAEGMTGGEESMSPGLFGRFSNDARAAVVYAQDDARQLGHPIIGTEHVLCGLLHDPETPAGRALTQTGITLDAVLAEIQATDRARSGRRGRVKGHIPFSPRAKKVLELAMREALRLGDAGVGSGHILLGLIREGEGLAAQVLTRLGADLRTLRGVTTGLIDRTVPAPGTADPDGHAVIASVEALVEQRDRVAAERDALQREVERLRTLLRIHGVDPDEGGASVSA
jgi:hypothetical protein